MKNIDSDNLDYVNKSGYSVDFDDFHKPIFFHNKMKNSETTIGYSKKVKKDLMRLRTVRRGGKTQN